ncbi:hypothetical protein EVAR_2323_1 [Eumeta japonica]|uniref:Uncharacterized protein n=1 Tax=Eumeta variegata TaxID=151549 RepID=A0A4C1SIL6_EUMVA|nr:hypothetical protein EVAR_2323_1 [Eumeta japonica]
MNRQVSKFRLGGVLRLHSNVKRQRARPLLLKLVSETRTQKLPGPLKLSEPTGAILVGGFFVVYTLKYLLSDVIASEGRIIVMTPKLQGGPSLSFAELVSF